MELTLSNDERKNTILTSESWKQFLSHIFSVQGLTNKCLIATGEGPLRSHAKRLKRWGKTWANISEDVHCSGNRIHMISPALSPNKKQQARWENQYPDFLHYLRCLVLFCIVLFCFLTTKTAAAAAKSLQLCPTLCDPTEGSPPGSPVPGILQARTLEQVAVSFSNALKWKVKAKSLSRVWPSAGPWTAAFQAPPSMGFSRQEYWSRVPLPSPTTKTRDIQIKPVTNPAIWEILKEVLQHERVTVDKIHVEEWKSPVKINM